MPPVKTAFVRGLYMCYSVFDVYFLFVYIVTMSVCLCLSCQCLVVVLYFKLYSVKLCFIKFLLNKIVDYAF